MGLVLYKLNQWCFHEFFVRNFFLNFLPIKGSLSLSSICWIFLSPFPAKKHIWVSGSYKGTNILEMFYICKVIFWKLFFKNTFISIKNSFTQQTCLVSDFSEAISNFAYLELWFLSTDPMIIKNQFLKIIVKSKF